MALKRSAAVLPLQAPAGFGCLQGRQGKKAGPAVSPALERGFSDQVPWGYMPPQIPLLLSACLHVSQGIFGRPCSCHESLLFPLPMQPPLLLELAAHPIPCRERGAPAFLMMGEGHSQRGRSPPAVCCLSSVTSVAWTLCPVHARDPCATNASPLGMNAPGKGRMLLLLWDWLEGASICSVLAGL